MGPFRYAETPVGGDPTGTGMEGGREGGKTEARVSSIIHFSLCHFWGLDIFDTNIRLH